MASALRWVGNAVLRAPAALIALQALHGMTFGMFWSAGIALVAATVPPKLRATGQALLVMAINVGGAVGNLAVGRLYDTRGPEDAVRGRRRRPAPAAGWSCLRARRGDRHARPREPAPGTT